jgi:hypothetical protein
MSKDPKAEIIFKMKILANSRPKDDTDQDWAVRILSAILPQMFGRITHYLTRNSDIADKKDGKPLPFDDVIDGLSAVLCENLCSTWFMAGGSKAHLLKAIDEMYTVFEEEMTSATESPLDPDGDAPIPTVTGVGHA